MKGRSLVVSRWSLAVESSSVSGGNKLSPLDSELGAGSLLWISSRNKLARCVFRFAVIGAFGGYPPPPGSLKRLLGAGFTKSVCKILIAKSLEVKILKTIDLGLPRWG